jgi:pheromone shutdown protein TraB
MLLPPQPPRPALSLLLVGAGHVFRLEDPIRALIHRERPDVVALELDPARYRALLERAAGRPLPAPGPGTPRVYRRLAKFQEDIASGLGTQVGGEMLAAARAAQEVGSRIALIDRSAEESVRRLWAEMSFGERMRLLFSSLFARFRFRKSATVEQEIARYQTNPDAYIQELAKEYPTLKRVLLDERNTHMADRLRRLLQTHPRIVAIVGDGHVDGLVRLLDDVAPRVVRLGELQKGVEGPLRWRVGASGDRVTFSFDQHAPEGTLRRA